VHLLGLTSVLIYRKVRKTWNKEGGHQTAANYIIGTFMIYTPHETYLGGQIKEWVGGAGGIWEKNEMHTHFWWLNLKKSDNLQDLVIHDSIILKLAMNTYYGRVWTGFSWLGHRKVVRSYEHGNKTQWELQNFIPKEDFTN